MSWKQVEKVLSAPIVVQIVVAILTITLEAVTSQQTRRQ